MKEEVIAGEETVGSRFQTIEQVVRMTFERTKIHVGEEESDTRAKAITEFMYGREIVSIL